MAQAERITVLFPVGRFVGGNLYEPNTKDDQGNPLLVKSGPNKGQPTQQFYLAVAIPKTPGVTHWAAESVPSNPKIGNEAHPGKWGEAIWALAHRSWPHGQAQAPTFAWKIEDGDSQIPNKKGKKNCDREGFPGNWIVKFGTAIAPKLVNADGSQVIDAVGAIKPGYFVQVLASVASNQSDQSPGMFVGHTAVALSAYGPEIQYGPDVTNAGFGGMPLPAGASAVPVGAMSAPGAGVPGVPGAAAGVPGVPGAAAGVPGVPVPGLGVPAGVPGVPGIPGAAAPVPGVPIVPNPGFVAGAVGVPGVPGTIPAAPPQPQLVMTAKANGQPKEAFLAIPGWTEQLMIEQGFAVMQ